MQAVKRWSGGLRWAAGGAGGDGRIPAGAVDDHGVDPAQLPLVCIQPLVSHIARQQQDYTTHKTDEADCVMAR